MAERLAPYRSRDQGPTSVTKGSAPSSVARITDHFEQDSTSDGETTDKATEKVRLPQHQKRLRKNLPLVPVKTAPYRPYTIDSTPWIVAYQLRIASSSSLNLRDLRW
eukprot:gene15904-7237_t